MKKEKGITLIALVVTIVVLLILAGTSISMLKGDNGIITQAQKAKSSTVVENEIEYIELAYNSATINKLNKAISSDELQEELKTSVGDGKTKIDDNNDGTFTVTFSDTNHYYLVKNRKSKKN